MPEKGKLRLVLVVGERKVEVEKREREPGSLLVTATNSSPQWGPFSDCERRAGRRGRRQETKRRVDLVEKRA